MINENQKTYYVLTVDGKPVSERHESMMLAEMAKNQLSEEDQKVAEVTQIADNGQQVLLG